MYIQTAYVLATAPVRLEAPEEADWYLSSFKLKAHTNAKSHAAKTNRESFLISFHVLGRLTTTTHPPLSVSELASSLSANGIYVMDQLS